MSEVIEAALPQGGKAFLEAMGAGSWQQVLEGAGEPGAEVDLCAPAAAEQLLLALRSELIRRGRGLEAVEVAAALHAAVEARLGREHPDALLELGAMGALADRAGLSQRAGHALERAYGHLRRVQPSPDLRQAVVAGNLGVHYVRQGDSSAAEAVLERAYALRKRLAPDTVLTVAAQLAELKLDVGEVRRALELAQESLALHEQSLGPDHPRTVARAALVASALRKLERYREAAPLLERVLAAAERAGRDEAVADARYGLGLVYARLEQGQQSQRYVKQAIDWTRQHGRVDGLPHAELAARLVVWAGMAEVRGQHVEAEGCLLEALEAERQLHGDLSSQAGLRQAQIGEFLWRFDRLDEALGFMDVGATTLRSTLGDQHEHTYSAVESLVSYLVERAEYARSRQNDRATASDLLARAQGFADEVLGFDHPMAKSVRRMAR